jgi:hypothetical protein
MSFSDNLSMGNEEKEAEALAVIDELRALQQQLKSLARQAELLQAQVTELLWRYEQSPRQIPVGQTSLPEAMPTEGYGSRYATRSIATPTDGEGAMHDITGCTGRQSAFSAFRRPI